MAIYFIADQHFGIPGENEEKIDKFSKFIDYIKGCEALFIVGDLFDFYFEYKTQIPKVHFNVLNILSSLRKSGTEIHYIVGNHDFWVGDFLTKELGIKVYKNPIQLTLQGKNIFIAHGNEIIGFDFARWLLRNKFSIFLFYHLHPDIAQFLAILVSRASSMLSRRKRISWRKLYTLGKEKFNSGTDMVILAHIHSPRVLHWRGKKFILLGDWIKYFSYGKLEGSEFKLYFWPACHSSGG